MDLGIKGLRAIVTGGTKGIGRAIVETLATEGCAVAFCARNAEEVSGAVSALKIKGMQVSGRALDVADASALQKWVHDVATEFSGIDLVIANVSAL
ncbi:MAG: SDR family NAD(P)-dependent oxidoreductase, partial [Burkholderiales bacterium]